ncbi:hypothetical protein FRC02_007279 [Tulasnella sp. 418]|nr:hypothetical protein FRC02_007279 [Tulasnella sp. 418]
MLLPHHILLSLAATFPSIALAALYPTYPTADTPLEAGQDTILKWKNDKNQPAIWDLGRLRIDLFVGDDDHHVTTLAKNINPEDRAALVRIEPWVGADADD